MSARHAGTSGPAWRAALVAGLLSPVSALGQAGPAPPPPAAPAQAPNATTPPVGTAPAQPEAPAAPPPAPVYIPPVQTGPPPAPTWSPGYPAPYPYAPAPYREPPPPEPPWPSGPAPDYLRHKLTLQTEAVFSADEGPFYNHLLGGRYDYHVSRATSLGAYAGYANLKGTQRRVHSALLLGQLEYHFFFGSDERYIVPLRAGLGYLFDNGLVGRFATGFYYAVRDDLEVGMDLITPMFWTASNDTVFSMNLALEATLAF